MSSRSDYKSEPEEFIQVLKERFEELRIWYEKRIDNLIMMSSVHLVELKERDNIIDDLKSNLKTEKLFSEELQRQHKTDLQIIELYREKIREKETVQDRLSEEGK